MCYLCSSLVTYFFLYVYICTLFSLMSSLLGTTTSPFIWRSFAKRACQKFFVRAAWSSLQGRWRPCVGGRAAASWYPCAGEKGSSHVAPLRGRQPWGAWRANWKNWRIFFCYSSTPSLNTQSCIKRVFVERNLHLSVKEKNNFINQLCNMIVFSF